MIHDPRREALFVALAVRDHLGARDAEVREQLSSTASVLAGDEGGVLKASSPRGERSPRFPIGVAMTCSMSQTPRIDYFVAAAGTTGAGRAGAWASVQHSMPSAEPYSFSGWKTGLRP